MAKFLKLVMVLSVFSFFAAANSYAQTVQVSDQAGLYQAINDGKDDLSITSGPSGLILNATAAISNYPSLYMHAASTETTYFSGNSIAGNMFDITDSSVTFEDIGFKDLDGNDSVFINSDNSDIAFKNAYFENNDSGSDDSAFIFTNYSKASFIGKTDFSGNTGSYGGGFNAAGSELTFNANTAFVNNNAESGGGFFSNIYFDSNTFEVVRSTINFNASVEFTSNTATSASGGGFTAMGSNINFNESAFMYNNAFTDGGAGLISGSTVLFSSTSVFEKNKAGGNGGALYITQASNVNFAKKVIFDENEAGGNGGALYMFDSSVTLENASFTGNKAAVSGGAIFLRGDADFESYAQLNINTVNNGATDNKTIFQGNTAGGLSNAIYLGEFSSVTFNTASGASVEMYDGIFSDTDTAFMVVTGAGDFNLYADADLYNLELISGNVNISSSNRVDVENFTADQNSVVNMKNTSYANILNAKNNFDFDGLLEIDGGSGEGADGDRVTAKNVNLGTNSKLDIQTDAAVDTSMHYRKRYYRVLNYEVLVGSFSQITLNNGVAIDSLSMEQKILSENNWLTVSITGNDISTQFSEIAGLSYNQKQVAKTFDKLSAETLSLDLDEQISAVDALANDDLKKSALLDASGYFLANVVRSAAMDSDKQDIYSRVKYHDMDAHNLNGIWTLGKVQNTEIDDDGNSINKYKDFETGALAGWDIMLDDNGLALGVYGKYNKHDIKQDVKNEAVIEDYGVGFYGGLLKDDWELKALVCGSMNNFTTTRYISYADRKAEGDFSAMTLGFDMEGAIRSYVTESVLLRPFAGFEMKNTNYDSFSETGAGDLSLQVAGDSYLRSAARIGLGVSSDDDVKIEWYAAIEGKYLLTEDIPEITAAFTTTSDNFISQGAKEGSTIITLGGGGAYRISDSIKIFANASYQSAEGIQHIYGNLGVRFLLLGK